MARVLVIMPLRADKDSETKRNSIIDIFGNDAILPRVEDSNGTEKGFDVLEAIDLLKLVDLVIADLSFERPSCYYELGMAQAMQVPTFLIAEAGTELHQHFGPVTYYKNLDEYCCIIKLVAIERAK